MRRGPVAALVGCLLGLVLPAAAEGPRYEPGNLIYFFWSQGELAPYEPPTALSFEGGSASARNLFPADMTLPALEPLMLETMTWGRLDEAGRVIDGGQALRLGDKSLRFGTLVAYQELWLAPKENQCSDQGLAGLLALADATAERAPDGTKVALRMALSIQYLINCGAETKVMREAQWELTRQQLAACTDMGWFTCADAMTALLSYIAKDPGFAGVSPSEYPAGVSRILQRVAFFLTDAARCGSLPGDKTAAALEEIKALVERLVPDPAMVKDALIYIAGRQADLPVKKQDCP